MIVMRKIICFALLLSSMWMTQSVLNAEDNPAPKIRTVNTKWFGQSFVYITSSAGVRVAIDPFENKTNRYPIPVNIPVDIILVTNEDADHNNTDFFAGNPVIFRSATGEGTNRGNGIIFKGVPAVKNPASSATIGNKSIIYCFSLDGVRFCHIGAMGQQNLTRRQLQQIGAVDVLFIPVGNRDHDEIIEQLKPRIVIPIHYKTPLTEVALYSVEESIKNRKVRRFQTNDITISREMLPSEMEVWIYANPPDKIPEAGQP